MNIKQNLNKLNKIIKKWKKIILIVLKMTIGRTYNSTKHFIL